MKRKHKHQKQIVVNKEKGGNPWYLPGKCNKNDNNVKAQTPAAPVTTTEAVTIKECFNKIKSLFILPVFTELEFTPYSWVKINCYINLIGSLEITGLGKIENNQITDIKLIKQTVKSARVDCNARHVADFIREVGANEIHKWKLDWHSHVDFATSPSGTDWDNYKEMSAARRFAQFPVMIINQSQSIYCNNYINESRLTPIKIFIPQFNMEESEVQSIYDECKKDIEDKCVEEKSTYNYRSGGGTNYNYADDDYWDRDYDYVGGGHGYNAYNKSSNLEKLNVPSNTQRITEFNQPKEKCVWCHTNELETEEEMADGICEECVKEFQLPVQTIKACRNCGAELAYPEEESSGFCLACLEELAVNK